MNVDRCVCFEVSFARLKQYADAHGGGYEALRQEFNCGRGCGLCIPYIREMLRTGETSFPVHAPADVRSSV